MKKISLLVVLLVTFLSFASTPTSAQILYDNGVGTGGYGYYADVGSTFSEAGDVFTAGLSGTVNFVDFSGLYYGGSTPTTDSFVLSLYSVNSGAPNTLIASTTSLLPSFSRTPVGTHTTTTGGTLTVYQFSGFVQTPLTLAAGTSYYFGISDTSNPYQNFAVVISDTVPAGGSTAEFSRIAGTSTFSATGPDALSFQLQSLDVPEPSAWELLALSCVGLVLARKCALRSPRA